MISEIIRFVFTAFLGSVCFLNTHVITAYTADPKQFTNRPLIMHHYPWIGTVAGLLSILIFILMPINGWFIWRWFGALGLTLFWLSICNPVVRSIFRRPDPFIHILVATPLLFGLTIVNFLLFK